MSKPRSAVGIGTLELHVEPEQQEEAPVRSAHDYIDERRQHMDYAEALAAGLPIGSGEVKGGQARAAATAQDCRRVVVGA